MADPEQVPEQVQAKVLRRREVPESGIYRAITPPGFINYPLFHRELFQKGFSFNWKWVVQKQKRKKKEKRVGSRDELSGARAGARWKTPEPNEAPGAARGARGVQTEAKLLFSGWKWVKLQLNTGSIVDLGVSISQLIVYLWKNGEKSVLFLDGSQRYSLLLDVTGNFLLKSSWKLNMWHRYNWSCFQFI